MIIHTQHEIWHKLLDFRSLMIPRSSQTFQPEHLLLFLATAILTGRAKMAELAFVSRPGGLLSTSTPKGPKPYFEEIHSCSSQDRQRIKSLISFETYKDYSNSNNNI